MLTITIKLNPESSGFSFKAGKISGFLPCNMTDKQKQAETLRRIYRLVRSVHPTDSVIFPGYTFL